MNRTSMLAVLCALSTAALAQDNEEIETVSVEDDKDKALEEIVITGTKSGKTLQDTEVSVELFSAEKIDRGVAFTLEDLYARTPNVSSFGGASSGDISIRGVGRNGVGGSGTGFTSNIYVDGAPLTTLGAQGIQSLWDIGSVEILRGPQATVQGRNALAGAVVVNTKDPTYDWEMAARARVGNLGERQVSAAVSGPIIDDQLAFRLSTDYQNFDGEPINFFTGKRSQARSGLSFRAKLLAEPEALPWLRAEIIFDHIDSDIGDFSNFGVPFAIDDPRFAEYDVFNEPSVSAPDFGSNEATRIIGDFNITFSDEWDLVLLGTYEDSSNTRNFGDIDNPGQFPEGSDTFANNFNDILSLEARFNFDYGNLRGWFGGYYFEDEFDSNQTATLLIQNAVPFPVNPANSVGVLTLDNDSVTENYAFFGQIAYDFNEHWSIEIGARIDHEDFTSPGFVVAGRAEPADCTVSLPQPTPNGVVFVPVPCVALLSDTNDPPLAASFDAFLPKVALTYKIDDDRSLTFSVQRGYRAGGSFLRQTPGNDPQLGTFDAEFLTNYELAFRSQWFDRRLTANVNIYYADWTDQQVSIPGPSNTPLDFFTENAGQSELYGLELSLNAVINDELDAFFSLGLQETEFTDFPFAVAPPAAAGNPFENLAGNQFPLTPNMTLSTGISYNRQDGIFADASINYTDSQFADVENLEVDKSDAFTSMNARLGYRDPEGRFEIFAYADNLLDDRAVLGSFGATVDTGTGTVEVNPSGNTVVNINTPRSFGLAFNVNF